ncbi:MAG: ParA family protein [Hyphomicrobium sp.]|nr:ParA family protein [Hyphomicrobium sp.]
MIITLASSKGGVGKSTITGCLAGVWAADGNTVHIVDLDNNRTVSRWFSDTARRPDGITVSTPDPIGLTEHLAELTATTAPDLILIDVAGTYERALTVAVARAHLTLIPAAPTEADIFEAARVARHITSVFHAFGREPLYRVLLNRVQPLASGAQLYATLEIVRLKLPRLKTRIHQRAAYEELGLSGLPPHFADLKRPTVAKAVEELDAVRADIEDLLKSNHVEALEGAA